VKVLIPSALRSYTDTGLTEAAGATLGDVLAELDRRHPGLRFRIVDEQERIRRHIRVFVSGTQVTDLGHRLRPTDEIAIVQALSGG